MPWVLVAFMALYGLLCFVFAAVEPPSAIQSLFRVPALFVFLPERLIVPVGRVFVGICSIGVSVFIATRFLSAMP